MACANSTLGRQAAHYRLKSGCCRLIITSRHQSGIAVTGTETLVRSQVLSTFSRAALRPYDSNSASRVQETTIDFRAKEWTPVSRRTGLIGRKRLTTQLWDEDGARVHITVLHVQPNYVTQVKTENTDNYFALQLAGGGFVWTPYQLDGAFRGVMEKASVPFQRTMAEFKVTEDALMPLGTKLSVEHFVKGQYVDVSGTSRGKGYQGVMKRWGFKGMPASHGVSVTHRHGGSTGQRKSPGRVFKGKKMAGNMGNERSTALNLRVFKVDPENCLLYVTGPVPGPENGIVRIRDAIKKRFYAFPSLPPPFPTFEYTSPA